MCVKENGCILFVGQSKGCLLVASKHCIGGPHAEKGEQWLRSQLAVPIDEFIDWLARYNVTCVLELADDGFEGALTVY